MMANRCRRELTRTEVQCLMNDINEDLRFTTEIEDDFENKRLPTLSFEIWCGEDGIRHSYFEKSMRSQILTMSKSSQAENSKYSILVNELSRRFEMMDSNISAQEKIETVDHFTQQLVNSGYNAAQISDIIVSSLKGIMRKERRLKEKGGSKYRSAEESLMDRMYKKLLEATSWYKEQKDYTETEEDKAIEDFFKSNDSAWKNFREKEKMGNNEYRKRKRKQKRYGENSKGEISNKIQAVIFVQHTPFSEMAKRMRKKLDSLEKLGKIKMKLVERAGNKMVDVLHKSNAWSEMDCSRDYCII